jgi:hypothetical protein
MKILQIYIRSFGKFLDTRMLTYNSIFKLVTKVYQHYASVSIAYLNSARFKGPV